MLFAATCRVCGRQLVSGEKMFCLSCETEIPLWCGSREDLRAHRFPRTLPVEGVWPWLIYTNSNPFCALLRRGKFNDRPEIIEEMAARYAGWIKSAGLLNGVDAIVPVPMHWWKRLRRGYNQAELIAAQISRHTGIPLVKALRAARPHSVQSRKTGSERAANVAGLFALSRRHTLPSGSRIAVVDDILTTGSTLSEAMNALSGTSPAAFYVLTLAATRLG